MQFTLKTTTFLKAIVIASLGMTATVSAELRINYDPTTQILDLPRINLAPNHYSATAKYDPTSNQLTLQNLKESSVLTFKDSKSGLNKTVSITDLIANVPPKEIQVFDPLEKRNLTYKAMPTNAVFDFVYGTGWRTQEELLMTALDGYASSVSVSRLLSYDSYLAYDFAGKNSKGLPTRPLFIDTKASDGIQKELGPFFLIWDNLTKSELQSLGSYGWPFQMGTFDFVKYADRFPLVVPPATSSDQVKSGYAAAKTYCLICHTVNKQAGGSASELNIPTSVTETTTDERLLSVMLDISARPDVSGMVIREQITNRTQLAQDILVYLKEMAKNKAPTATK